MICWKIRIFAYWTTPYTYRGSGRIKLWFAEKFVSLLIEQHRLRNRAIKSCGCDLLKNSYLCLLNNTLSSGIIPTWSVVICWKIRIFAYWTTPVCLLRPVRAWLWFAEKFVSLLIEQHQMKQHLLPRHVVICWKIRIFAYWTTPYASRGLAEDMLWFAEKFVSLLIEQHHAMLSNEIINCCDLLKNSYLCLLNNTWLCGSSSIWECCKQW